MDWKDMLADIVKKKESRPGTSEPADPRAQMDRFLSEVALPAFQDIRSELEKHGQRMKIERGSGYLSMTLMDAHGHEEFYYSIRVRTHRPASFAFPKFEPKDETKPISRAEVILRSGPASYDVSGLSREQLIRHFLHEYRKWIGWTNAGESPRR